MQTTTTQQAIETPIMADHELAALAIEYQKSAKIQHRITFVEFCANPSMFRKQAKLWPETVWKIDFSHVGQHHRIWINDNWSGTTIAHDHVPTERPADIASILKRTADEKGMPDCVRVEGGENLRNATVSAWCRHNNVKLQVPNPNKPARKGVAEITKEVDKWRSQHNAHRMGSFDQESTPVSGVTA